mmetsp:Transcript_103138/g.183264  ORF Transcript_103138/g.183264 Transcript_103138/m.183264 type:complete len:301 (+) Transcript_103138:1-903(+)
MQPGQSTLPASLAMFRGLAVVMLLAVASADGSLRGVEAKSGSESLSPGDSECTGTGKLPSGAALCYRAVFLVQLISVQVLSDNSDGGRAHMKAVGPKHGTCNASFQKSGKSLTIENAESCGLDASTFTVQYCSDQDAIHVRLTTPYNLTFPLSRTRCLDVEVSYDLAGVSQATEDLIACRFGASCHAGRPCRADECNPTPPDAWETSADADWGNQAWTSVGLTAVGEAVPEDIDGMPTDTDYDWPQDVNASFALANLIYCRHGTICKDGWIRDGERDVCRGGFSCDDLGDLLPYRGFTTP